MAYENVFLTATAVLTGAVIYWHVSSTREECHKNKRRLNVKHTKVKRVTVADNKSGATCKCYEQAEAKTDQIAQDVEINRTQFEDVAQKEDEHASDQTCDFLDDADDIICNSTPSDNNLIMSDIADRFSEMLGSDIRIADENIEQMAKDITTITASLAEARKENFRSADHTQAHVDSLFDSSNPNDMIVMNAWSEVASNVKNESEILSQEIGAMEDISQKIGIRDEEAAEIKKQSQSTGDESAFNETQKHTYVVSDKTSRESKDIVNEIRKENGYTTHEINGVSDILNNPIKEKTKLETTKRAISNMNEDAVEPFQRGEGSIEGVVRFVNENNHMAMINLGAQQKALTIQTKTLKNISGHSRSLSK